METFSHSRRVTFAETDAAGIAHFAQFPRWVEEAEAAFWRANGIASPSLSDGCLTGFPRVSFSIRYRLPVHFDDVLGIVLKPRVISASVLEWAFRIRRGAALCATGTMVVVFAQGNPLLGQLTSTPIPPALLAALPPSPSIRHLAAASAAPTGNAGVPAGSLEKG
jgi:YbgC/YbaW family acyl-CoA thioester hydrolase